MLRDKLNQLLEDLMRLDPPPERAAWDAKLFEEANRKLLALLDGAADRLGGFRQRVELRRGMQALYSQAGDIDPALVHEIWREQYEFYPQLIEEIQSCIDDGQPSTITFSLTVAELLFLLRLFVENQVVQTETLRPILKFFSEHAQTPQGRKLSFSSLQKKYSRVQPETQRRIKRLLMDLAMRVDTT